MVRRENAEEAAVTADRVRSAQKRLRARIADAIVQSADHRLSLTEQATAVEAELLVQGFDARVMPWSDSSNNACRLRGEGPAPGEGAWPRDP